MSTQGDWATHAHDPDRQWLDEEADRFEQQWRSGKEPSIAEFLARHDRPRQALLLPELIMIDLEWRWRTGQRQPLEKYFSKWPNLRGKEFRGQVLELARVECRVRVQHGERVSVEDYRRRFGSLDPQGLALALEPVLGSVAAPERIGRYKVLRRLDEGAFGIVYEGLDEHIDRQVAIKVARTDRMNSRQAVEAFLREARNVARLKHPGIVAVHDFGEESGRCYLVYELIQGMSLKDRLSMGKVDHAQAALLAAKVAEALHVAHRHDVIHRDIKPANVLLDRDEQPYLIDFGLGVREEELGAEEGRLAGTYPYMAPEMVRGEGHRIDGRADIYGMGVLLYEMLCGRRPFAGDSVGTLVDQILYREPRPLRQIDDSVPRELERICLKALSKRVTDRYATAKDLADELRAAIASDESLLSSVGTTARARPAMVPRGLRSFGPEDAGAFLQLLPGPRDTEGLPEVIRFWKSRIESDQVEETFTVGLLYGPSGCGKTSLVRAGLLPRLAQHVIPVYVEAIRDGTDARLLSALRQACPELDGAAGLSACIAALRCGAGISAGRKVVVVIDQLEQWLHGQDNSSAARALVAAIRQSDGVHVQFLLLARVDFWLAVCRLFDELEVPLVMGQNVGLVDLFDQRHARRVLALFGRAYGRLPDDPAHVTHDQERFLDSVVAGLSQEGRVISVRLSLLAEMMKNRAWTPRSLVSVGGLEGVGVAFLEEMFCADTANPHHRLYEKPAREVLAALLPESGSDIKGRMRSRAELMAAAGMQREPRRFDHLLEILDHELRIITPTEAPETTAPAQAADDAAIAPTDCPPSHIAGGDHNGDAPPVAAFYQLTHDYLIPSLRQWLTARQKETMRGRAALRLAERAALWTAKPENTRLPSLWEWAGFHLLTLPARRTPGERRMLTAANRYYLTRSVALLALLAVAAWWTHATLTRQRVTALVDRLAEAQIAKVPDILDELAPYRSRAEPLLRQAIADSPPQSHQRLHAALALARHDPEQVDFLYERLLTAKPEDFGVIRQELRRYHDQLTNQLWNELETVGADPERRFRAACALAEYDSGNPHWDDAASFVAGQLVARDSLSARYWTDALEQVMPSLLEPIEQVYRRKESRPNEQRLAAEILAQYFSQKSDRLASLLLDASEIEFLSLLAELRNHEPRAVELLDTEAMPRELADDADAIRQANAAVALLMLDRPERVWPLFADGPDPRVAALIVHRVGRMQVAPDLMAERLFALSEGSERRGLILALGEIPTDRYPPALRQRLLEWLAIRWESDPDPGIHGATEYVLHKWEADDTISAARDRLQVTHAAALVDPAAAGLQWYVNSRAGTLVVAQGPVEFEMGTPDAPPKELPETRHTRRIERTFAVAAHEITLADLAPFRAMLDASEQKGIALVPRKENPEPIYRDDSTPPRDDQAADYVSWYEAVAYCNWLTRQELGEEHVCFDEIYDNSGNVIDFRVRDDCLSRRGYRLPTEAEWEYMCRAGTSTVRYFGNADELLDEYAFYLNNGERRPHPVGRKKPNALGMFDTLGNVLEWCLEKDTRYPAEPNASVVVDVLCTPGLVNEKELRAMRGGAFYHPGDDQRAAYRQSVSPGSPYPTTGFRLARTIATSE